MGRVYFKADTANKVIEFKYSIDQDLNVKSKKPIKVLMIPIKLENVNTYVDFMKNFITIVQIKD